MPQPALHVLIAHDLLDGWRRSPALAPFDIASPQAANHFFHGSLGPDIGFFPGGDTRLSGLVHTGGAVEVARRLMDTARTDAERAFAWGWISHVLADVEVHPIIDAAADALLRAEGATATDPASRMIAHVRIEVGLDAWHVRHRSARRALRLRHALGPDRIGWLGHALATTYGLRIHDQRLLASHRGVTRWYQGHLRLLAWIAAEHAGERRAAALLMKSLRAIASRIAAVHSPVRGFVATIAPTPDLLARVQAGLARVTSAFARHVESRLSRLQEFDLETGRPAEASAYTAGNAVGRVSIGPAERPPVQSAGSSRAITASVKLSVVP
jgi:hypothetical protein